MGAHPDPKIQTDWDADGTGALTFEVLDVLAPRDDPGYNPDDDLR